MAIERSLEVHIEQVYHGKKLDLSPSLKKKIYDLYNLLTHYNTVILSGSPMNGKTTTVTCLVDIINSIHKERKERKPVQGDEWETFIEKLMSYDPMIQRGLKFQPITIRAYSEAFLLGQQEKTKVFYKFI